MTGLPIVAPRLGAFSERLADYPHTWLLDWDTPVAECNDLFVNLLEGKSNALAEPAHDA